MTIARVKFSSLKRIAYIQTDQEVEPGKNCIADIKGDRFLAKILNVQEAAKVPISASEDDRFIRYTDEADEIHYDLQVRRSFFFLSKAHEFVKKHQVGCKILAAEPTFDVKRIIFYFAAEGFLNFKNLIKEMSVLAKAQIEFRQVEGRERAKLTSDIGMCGLQTCCTRFLFETPIISRQDVEGMWKNESDYLGVCGRIKCCATFEKREAGSEGCGSGGCESGGCSTGSSGGCGSGTCDK